MNKRKLNLIFAVSLTTISAVVQAVPKKAVAAAALTLPAIAKTYSDALGQEPSAVDLALIEPVIVPTVPLVEPILGKNIESNIHSVETSVGFLAKTKNIFTSYANKDAVKNGVNAVVAGVKTHKEAAIGAAGLVAFAGVMKAYEYYNALTSIEEQTPVVGQAPIVEQAPVVELVVEQAPVKEVSPVVKLTVAEIANTQGANVQGVIDALKAHGYTKIDLKASDLKQAGKLNDGQIRFIISRIR